MVVWPAVYEESHVCVVVVLLYKWRLAAHAQCQPNYTHVGVEVAEVEVGLVVGRDVVVEVEVIGVVVREVVLEVVVRGLVVVVVVVVVVREVAVVVLGLVVVVDVREVAVDD